MTTNNELMQQETPQKIYQCKKIACLKKERLRKQLHDCNCPQI